MLWSCQEVLDLGLEQMNRAPFCCIYMTLSFGLFSRKVQLFCLNHIFCPVSRTEQSSCLNKLCDKLLGRECGLVAYTLKGPWNTSFSQHYSTELHEILWGPRYVCGHMCRPRNELIVIGLNRTSAKIKRKNATLYNHFMLWEEIYRYSSEQQMCSCVN